MTTELIVGVIGFGTAVVGLATAYLSRTRHVIHRHEHSETRESEPSAAVRAPEIELEVEDEREDCEDVPTVGGSQESGGNKYGQAAIRAVERCRGPGARLTPPEAWESATTELFGAGTPAQRKGCPKGAFLGLCQAGYVVGVPSGDYCRSVKNRDYAVAAAELLAREPQLAEDCVRLWQRVLGGVTKQHNSQMHVVLALWRSGLLSVPERTRA